MRRTMQAILTGAALLLATSVAAPAALAQDQASADAAIVGTWLAHPFPGDPTQVSLITFTADGSLVTIDNQGTTGLGAWSAADDGTFDLYFDELSFGPDPTTIRANGQVSDDGQSFSGTWTLELPEAAAQQLGVSAGELGPGEVTAERISEGPMGEPVGPLPDFSQMAQPSATEVAVTLQEFSIIPEATTIPAGTVTLDANNVGGDEHELVIVKTDILGGELPTNPDGSFDEYADGVDVIGELEDVEPGTSKSGTFELPAGHYVFVCNIVEDHDGQTISHYQMGMWVDVEVTA
jgi:uncharacterized cupredoxin-like copper-binding protein